MSPTSWQALFAAAVLGHFGLHLALYNRLNALGLPRRMIKRTEKLLFAEMWLTLAAICWLYPQTVRDLASGTASLGQAPSVLIVYGWICLLTWVVFGIPWLIWRPVFRWEWADAARIIDVVNVQSTMNKPLALTAKCRWESKLPLNQIFDLAIEEVRLPVPGLPEQLDGYRIAQLSDIHLTGHVAPDYASYAVRRANDWHPDLFALTGDIIDKEPCIDWLVDVFSPADSPDGNFFVLGNHDTRVVDSWQTREAMDRAGWTDLGSRSLRKNLRGVDSLLIGNEHPWFQRPDLSQEPATEFRVLVSHSPDQIGWARRNDVRLMLAGHTHGGQGRLPIVGPLLSPSIHGSRYASGDFWKSPTTMHVSRGLGGVHLLRINCRPELSLIVLKSVSDS